MFSIAIKQLDKLDKSSFQAAKTKVTSTKLLALLNDAIKSPPNPQILGDFRTFKLSDS
jgi:hypothetical protein